MANDLVELVSNLRKEGAEKLSLADNIEKAARAQDLYGQNPAPAPAQVSPIFSLEGLGSVEAIVKTITLHGKKGMKVRNIAEKMLAHGYKNREGRTPPIEELNPRVANMLLTRNDVFERVSYGIYKVS